MNEEDTPSFIWGLNVDRNFERFNMPIWNIRLYLPGQYLIIREIAVTAGASGMPVYSKNTCKRRNSVYEE